MRFQLFLLDRYKQECDYRRYIALDMRKNQDRDRHNDFEYRLCYLRIRYSKHIHGGNLVVSHRNLVDKSIADSLQLRGIANLGHKRLDNMDLAPVVQLQYLLKLKFIWTRK